MTSKIGHVSYAHLIEAEKVLRDGYINQITEEGKSKTPTMANLNGSFSTYEKYLITAFNNLLKSNNKEIEVSSLLFTRVDIWSDLDIYYIKSQI